MTKVKRRFIKVAILAAGVLIVTAILIVFDVPYESRLGYVITGIGSLFTVFFFFVGVGVTDYGMKPMESVKGTWKWIRNMGS